MHTVHLGGVYCFYTTMSWLRSSWRKILEEVRLKRNKCIYILHESQLICVMTFCFWALNVGVGQGIANLGSLMYAWQPCCKHCCFCQCLQKLHLNLCWVCTCARYISPYLLRYSALAYISVHLITTRTKASYSPYAILSQLFSWANRTIWLSATFFFVLLLLTLHL